MCKCTKKDEENHKDVQKVCLAGLDIRKKEVLYDRDPRVAGKTKWNYKKLVDLAIDGITSFTTSPLKTSYIYYAYQHF